MTARHRERIEGLAETLAGTPDRIAEGRGRILDLVNRLAEMGVTGPEYPKGDKAYYREAAESQDANDRWAMERFAAVAGTKPASARTNAELVALFRALSEIGRGVGVVALEPVAKAYLDEELIREGAELAADCTDVEFMRQLLETRRDALLARYKRRLDMTVEASMKVAAGATPRIVEDICRTFA